MNHMEVTVFFMIPLALLMLALVIFLITMFVRLMILVFRALRKYLNSGPQRQEEEILRRSLGEVLILFFNKTVQQFIF